jgi:transposase InsO family protein
MCLAKIRIKSCPQATRAFKAKIIRRPVIDFQLLKRERIKRKIYTTREDARSDVFDYIEMFYNAKRRHGFNNQLSPVEFEKRYAMSLQGV